MKFKLVLTSNGMSLDFLLLFCAVWVMMILLSYNTCTMYTCICYFGQFKYVWIMILLEYKMTSSSNFYIVRCRSMSPETDSADHLTIVIRLQCRNYDPETTEIQICLILCYFTSGSIARQWNQFGDSINLSDPPDARRHRFLFSLLLVGTALQHRLNLDRSHSTHADLTT